jgi:O-antigen/teichoic acid export membrane protein
MRRLINKTTKVLQNDFVKVFSLSASSTFIKVITNFISIKVVAVIIGPSGVALIGQLSNFSNILLKIASGGNNSGVTKYLAEFKDEENEVQKIIGTSTLISLYLSLICGGILIGFADKFSLLILDDKKQDYNSIFVVFGITLFLYAFNAKLLSILNGFKQYRKFIIVDIVTSTVGLVFSLVLVFIWGVYGALLASVTYQSVVVFVSLFLVLKSKWFKWRFLFGGFDKAMAIKLSFYSIMALVSALTVPVSQMIVRTRIKNVLSLNEAGIWEGMNKISGLYLMVITTALGIYYLPKLSELKDSILIRKEIFKTAKLLLPFVTLMSVGIFLLRYYIIHIVFTPDFVTMEGLFIYQLLGDFFKICSWLLAYLMLAKTMTKVYVFTEIFSSTCWVVLSFILISYFGYQGATIAYAINYFINFLLMCFIFRNILFKNN